MTEPALTYFAVPDPDTGELTSWRRNRRGNFVPCQGDWGPTPPDTTGLAWAAQQEVLAAWVAATYQPWYRRVEAAILANPAAAAARFAARHTRCCVCGQPLTDAAAQSVGIGPECDRGLSTQLRQRLVQAMGQAHAADLVPPEG